MTTAQIQAYVNTLNYNLKYQFNVQYDILQLLMQRQESFEDEIAAFYEWVKLDGAWDYVVT
ncbi:hypothetical protein FQN50_009073 [Emmonsiellopsis sp. PD_5]|nr:hypothetical protein FQN50_009073 [Emmonsiellopsis sp. PD_5]